MKTAIKYLPSFAVVLVSAFCFFYRIDSKPVHVWDEALYANNSLEMLESGNMLVVQNEGEPSLINTKPPLGIWLQTLSMTVFGPNEFAIRFPTAMAGLGIILLLIVFFDKLYERPEIGALTGLILLSTKGFMRQHVMLSGDLDGLLLFFICCFSFGIFYFCLKNEIHSKKLILFIVFSFLFAYFTKSTAALLPLPGLVIILLLKRKFRYLFFQKIFLLSALASVILILLYYVFRENAASGYLQKVWFSEFTRIYNESMSWHVQPWNFYINNLTRLDLFYPHIYFLLPVILIGFFSKKYGQLSLINLVFILCFFAVISIPRIKLEHYDAPVYPFLCMALSLGIAGLLEWLPVKLIKHSMSAVLVIFSAAVLMTKLNERSTFLPSEPWEKDGYVMRELHQSRPELKKYTVLLKGDEIEPKYAALFYKNWLNRYHNYNIRDLDNIEQLNPGDTVLCMRPELFGVDSNRRFNKIQAGEFGMYVFRKE